MKKLIFLLIIFVLLIPDVLADFWGFDSSLKPPETLFTYLIPQRNMSNADLILGKNCLNISGGRLAGIRCLTPSIPTTNFICENDNDCFLPFTCSKNIVCELDTTELKIDEPVNTTSRALALILLVLVSFFFIIIGYAKRIGFIGFFGSILLMVTSWYISSSQAFIAFILGLLSLLLIIHFAVMAIGFRNETYS